MDEGIGFLLRRLGVRIPHGSPNKVNDMKLLKDTFGHKAGTTVYKLKYSDYGLASDDTRITGIEHTSVTLNEDGGYPSFTVPKTDIED